MGQQRKSRYVPPFRWETIDTTGAKESLKTRIQLKEKTTEMCMSLKFKNTPILTLRKRKIQRQNEFVYEEESGVMV